MAQPKFEWNKRGKNIFMEQAMVKAVNDTAYDLMQTITDARVVPYNEGNLQETVHVGKANMMQPEARIIWDFADEKSGYIYAARLYFHPEYNFQNGRKGRWADPWIYGSKKKQVLKLYKKNAKAVIGK